MIAALMHRGDEMLAVGDIATARLLYERVAASGSAPAATAVGGTYDPEVLVLLGVRGIQPDPAMAVTWYRRAADLGDAEATARLKRLGAGGTTQ
jgi:TPR repeat protein